MSIQHLLRVRLVFCARNSALHEAAVASALKEEADQQGRQTCQHYQQIICKDCGRKRPTQESTDENRTWAFPQQLKEAGPHWRMADKCSCYFHNSKNNTALECHL